jgi:hypothetical protein
VFVHVGLAAVRPGGPPGFGLYPELVRGHDGASFLVGQALAVNIFALLGFAFLLLAMRFAGRPNDSDGSAPVRLAMVSCRARRTVRPDRLPAGPADPVRVGRSGLRQIEGRAVVQAGSMSNRRT